MTLNIYHLWFECSFWFIHCIVCCFLTRRGVILPFCLYSSWLSLLSFVALSLNLLIAELAECSPINMQNSKLKKFGCTTIWPTIQGATFSMHSQLYHSHYLIISPLHGHGEVANENPLILPHTLSIVAKGFSFVEETCRKRKCKLCF